MRNTLRAAVKTVWVGSIDDMLSGHEACPITLFDIGEAARIVILDRVVVVDVRMGADTALIDVDNDGAFVEIVARPESAAECRRLIRAGRAKRALLGNNRWVVEMVLEPTSAVTLENVGFELMTGGGSPLGT